MANISETDEDIDNRKTGLSTAQSSHVREKNLLNIGQLAEKLMFTHLISTLWSTISRPLGCSGLKLLRATECPRLANIHDKRERGPRLAQKFCLMTNNIGISANLTKHFYVICRKSGMRIWGQFSGAYPRNFGAKKLPKFIFHILIFTTLML